MIDIIHEIRMHDSRNAKREVLERNRNNTLWRAYLKAVYDPFTNYFISSVNDNTFFTPEEHRNIDVAAMLNEARVLSTRTLTGNAAKKYALSMSRKYGELFRLLIGRSIDAGITATTINKVYSGLIPDFKMMLGKEAPIDRFPVWVSTKFDGVRLLAFVYGNGVELYTRKGLKLELDSLKNELSDFPLGVYDGELVQGNGRSCDRTKITGSVNKILKGTATEIDDYYTYCIFDSISHQEWKPRRCFMAYKDRFEYLCNAPPKENIYVVPQHVANNLDDIESIYRMLVRRGYEGIICRWPDDVYEWKRTDKLVKRKQVQEAVLKCVDVVLGEGKYAGMIGSLLCTGTVNGVDVEVSVGSGLSDEDRNCLALKYIGKNIEILYNDIVVSNKTGEHSLFLPRFKRVRGDYNV